VTRPHRWVSVSLPRALTQRVERIHRQLGYDSVAEYVRAAVREALLRDEKEVITK